MIEPTLPFNPLDFDLKGAIGQLEIDANNSQGSELLDLVSRSMLDPNLTLRVVRACRPIVIDLVARWTLPGFTSFLDQHVNKTELVAKAFSLMLPVVPQVKRYGGLLFKDFRELTRIILL
jgi:hypothetical protein